MWVFRHRWRRRSRVGFSGEQAVPYGCYKVALTLSPEPARKCLYVVHRRQHSGGAGDDAGVTGMADGTNGEAEGNTVSRASRQDTAHKNYGGDVFVAAEKVADNTGAPGTPMRRHLFRHAPLILQ